MAMSRKIIERIDGLEERMQVASGWTKGIRESQDYKDGCIFALGLVKENNFEILKLSFKIKRLKNKKWWEFWI